MDYTVRGMSPGQNTGVGSLSLLQGIFPTQELNPGLVRRFFTSWAIREAQKWKRRQIWYPMLNCPSSVIEWNRPRIFDLVKILPSSPDLDFMSSVLLDKVPSEVLVAQPSLALWDPMDCSLRGSSVHGILQARILEWVAMPSSRGSSQPRSPTLRADSLPSEPPGKPWTKHWVG